MWPNPQFFADVVTFTEEILIENFSFCAVPAADPNIGSLPFRNK